MVNKTPKRSKAQRELDILQVRKYYLMQMSLPDIANQTGLTLQQVRTDVNSIIGEWRKETATTIDEYKQRELARLDLVEAEMWECWYASKKKPKRIINRSSGKKFRPNDFNPNRPDYRREEVIEEESHGNIEYMNVIMQCHAQRAKILGILAPKKIAQTDPTGEKEASRLSAREELLSLIGDVSKKLQSSRQLALPEPAIDVEVIEDETPIAEKVEELVGNSVKNSADILEVADNG